MKKAIRSFVTFNRTERIGLAALCLALVVLLSVRATMALWVHPSTNEEQNKKLITAAQTFQRIQPIIHTDTTAPTTKDYQDRFDEQTTPLPDQIDLNTADSATLVRLKGIGPTTAGKIIARRNKKPFTNISQLSEVGRIPHKTLELLKKHLFVGAQKH